MKRLTLAVSALAIVLAGAGAVAAEMPDHTFTRAEAREHAQKLFDEMDVNHDGKLDQADRAARMGAMFDRIDTNHDGQISREEFLAAHEKMMREHPMGPMGMGRDAPPPGGPGMMGHMGGMMRGGMGHHHGMGPMGGHMMAMAIIQRADPQHTGTVTREAFVAAALARFDAADANHDGKLSSAERRAAWRAARHGAHDRMEQGMHHHHGHDADDMPPPPPPGA